MCSGVFKRDQKRSHTYACLCWEEGRGKKVLQVKKGNHCVLLAHVTLIIFLKVERQLRWLTRKKMQSQLVKSSARKMRKNGNYCVLFTHVLVFSKKCHQQSPSGISLDTSRSCVLTCWSWDNCKDCGKEGGMKRQGAVVGKKLFKANIERKKSLCAACSWANFVERMREWHERYCGEKSKKKAVCLCVHLVHIAVQI